MEGAELDSVQRILAGTAGKFGGKQAEAVDDWLRHLRSRDRERTDMRARAAKRILESLWLWHIRRGLVLLVVVLAVLLSIIYSNFVRRQAVVEELERRACVLASEIELASGNIPIADIGILVSECHEPE